MKRNIRRYAAVLTLVFLVAGCSQSPSNHDLTGAWRAKVQFASGAFAPIKDLEFLYVFNDGGTLMESSNYDAAPPVPPAYGVWRKIGDHKYEAKYEFFITRVPDSTEGTTATVGWLPAGHGVLVDTITLLADGNSFKSTTQYKVFDRAEKPVSGGGEAKGEGVRVTF